MEQCSFLLLRQGYCYAIEQVSLLDICKSNNLVILNGRCGDDKYVGATTFRNCSVIDYSIASYQSLSHVNNFRIDEVDNLFSDGHSLLTTELNFDNNLKNASKKTVNKIKVNLDGN